jgi:hypothetical protein
MTFTGTDEGELHALLAAKFHPDPDNTDLPGSPLVGCIRILLRPYAAPDEVVASLVATGDANIKV